MNCKTRKDAQRCAKTRKDAQRRPKTRKQKILKPFLKICKINRRSCGGPGRIPKNPQNPDPKNLQPKRFGCNECRQSERCCPLCMPLGARASDVQSCLSALGACHALGDSQLYDLYRVVSASATRRAVAFQDERPMVLASWS